MQNNFSSFKFYAIFHSTGFSWKRVIIFPYDVRFFISCNIWSKYLLIPAWGGSEKLPIFLSLMFDRLSRSNVEEKIQFGRDDISTIFLTSQKREKSLRLGPRTNIKKPRQKGMKTEGKEKLIKSESVRVHRCPQQPQISRRPMKSSQVVVCVMCVAFILQNDKKKIPKAKKVQQKI